MTVLSATSLKLLVILYVISVTFTKHVKNKEEKSKCVEISVNGVSHKEEVLINGVNRPYQISYYKKNKTDQILYFSYNVGMQNESTFEIGYSKGGYPLPVPIKEVKNGFATAINHEEDIIYLGGSEGIYVHNITTGKHTEILIPKHDIWDLFYKDSLYFIVFPSRRLYKHHAGHSELQEHIHEKIFNFVIDGDGDTFMNNKSGLYMIKNDTTHRIHIKGPKVFRAFEVNRKGVAHFCGRNEVYVVDKEKHKLKEIAQIKNIFGLTFDNDDNFIYSDPHQIVRLKRGKCEDKPKKKN